MFPSASFPQMPNIYPMAIRHSKSRLFPLAVREVIDLYRDNGQEAPKQITIAASSMLLISIIRLSAKGTDGVMKRGCFRLKLMFAILSTGVFGTLQKPWGRVAELYSGNPAFLYGSATR